MKMNFEEVKSEIQEKESRLKKEMETLAFRRKVLENKLSQLKNQNQNMLDASTQTNNKFLLSEQTDYSSITQSFGIIHALQIMFSSLLWKNNFASIVRCEESSNSLSDDVILIFFIELIPNIKNKHNYIPSSNSKHKICNAHQSASKYSKTSSKFSITYLIEMAKFHCRESRFSLSDSRKKYKLMKKTLKSFLELSDCSRHSVWLILLGNRARTTKQLFYYCRSQVAIGKLKPEIDHVICEDLKRVLRYYLNFWSNEDIKNLTKCENKEADLSKSLLFFKLRDVLGAFQIFRPDIGYVQGMCRLSFILYSETRSCYDTFMALTNLLLFRSPYYSLYTLEDQAITYWENEVKEFAIKFIPNSYAIINDMNPLAIKFFVMENFLLLFANYFEEQENKIIWDLYLFFGESFLILMSIGIMASTSRLGSTSLKSFEQLKELTALLGVKSVIKSVEDSGLKISTIKKLMKEN